MRSMRSIRSMRSMRGGFIFRILLKNVSHGYLTSRCSGLSYAVGQPSRMSLVRMTHGHGHGDGVFILATTYEETAELCHTSQSHGHSCEGAAPWAFRIPRIQYMYNVVYVYVSAYMYMYVCVHIYIYIYIYIYIHTYIYIYIFIYIYTYRMLTF